jgi:5-methylcytosine-specific restriction endonuclease McrA
MIYLYVKTHNKTGLKYLGKTEQDPFVYLGSGKRWLNHLNKHGVISEKAKIRRANGFKPVEKHTKETKEKRNVSGLLKKKIAASQEWKCGSCAALLDETYEVDHKLALFQGGTNEPDNLVALCPNCHRHKTVEERLNQE